MIFSNKEKKKRGRKPKIEVQNNNSSIEENSAEKDILVEVDDIKVPKKRGRKPKGGKIITCIKNNIITENEKPNIILHLKCTIKDLTNNYTNEKIKSYNLFDMKTNELEYQYIKNIQVNNEEKNENNFEFKNINESRPISDIINETENNCFTKDIQRKLNELSINLHTNNIPEKKSCCFWCTYEFDNPTIYIPKYQLKESYYVYGCFCSLECACAFLMNENIDQASKMERYSLLNYIYGKLYNYEKNIKPAPNPFYTLEKFCGNLSIQEYRKLLNAERLLLVVDKPLSRQLPELHEDNDDFLLNNRIGINVARYQIKKNNNTSFNKNSIMQEQFNVT